MHPLSAQSPRRLALPRLLTVALAATYLPASLADTALSMAVDPLMVRRDAFDRAARGGRAEGVSGDPRAATAQLGQPGLELIVVNSVAAIRAQLGSAAAAASAPRSTIPRSKD